jgi:aminomethyltransferase
MAPAFRGPGWPTPHPPSNRSADPAPRRARRRRRASGAFRGLRHAGPVPDRDSVRAPVDARARRACSTCRTWGRRRSPARIMKRPARALEALIPADVLNLKPASSAIPSCSPRRRDPGRPDGDAAGDGGGSGPLYLVVNASTKEADYAHVAARLPRRFPGPRRRPALLALQGPAAEGVLRRLGGNGAADLAFMTTGWFEIAGLRCHVSRSGYTGEDGFEISVKDGDAVRPVAGASRRPGGKPVRPRGRSSLRPKRALCLYGHDIDPTHDSPWEAGLDLVDSETSAAGGRLSGRRADPARTSPRASGPRPGRARPEGRRRPRGRPIQPRPGPPRGRIVHLRRPSARASTGRRHGLRREGERAPGHELLADRRGRPMPA